MSKNVFLSAQRICEKFRKKYDSVLVGFSGGKESIVTLDLCVRHFPVVVPYHFLAMPWTDLECKAAGMKALDRHNLRDSLLVFPSSALIKYFRFAYYRHWDGNLFRSFKDAGDKNRLNFVRGETGIDLIATGLRKKDSQSRRRMFARMYAKSQRGVIPNEMMPLRDWTKYDVYAYLKANKYEIPATSGTATFDVDLSNDCILYLHDAWPTDYAKMKSVFPFVEAVIKRREFYGVGKFYTKLGPVAGDANK